MSKIYIIHYGSGGELDRREATDENQLEDVISDMGPWAVGDTIKIVAADNDRP